MKSLFAALAVVLILVAACVRKEPSRADTDSVKADTVKVVDSVTIKP